MSIKPVNYTKTELKSALQIVSDYLFNSLLQNPPNTKIKLGSVGYLTKKERSLSGHLDNRHYVYYHIHFKKSQSLKQILDQQIINVS